MHLIFRSFFLTQFVFVSVAPLYIIYTYTHIYIFIYYTYDEPALGEVPADTRARHTLAGVCTSGVMFSRFLTIALCACTECIYTHPPVAPGGWIY